MPWLYLTGRILSGWKRFEQNEKEYIIMKNYRVKGKQLSKI
jgi:hypothetical protein